MGANGRLELGTSQRQGKGFPQLPSLHDAHRLRRTGLVAVAFVALFISMAATSAAIEGHADAGVVIDEDGRIADVSPTGFAWRDGIRPGQLVVESRSSADPDGWLLVTMGAAGPIESRERPVLAALRQSLLFALVGLGAGCLAVAFLRINRAWVLPCACLALLGSSVPFFLANQTATVAVLAAAALVPAAGLAYRFRKYRPAAIALVSGAVALVAIWAGAFSGGAASDPLEQSRRAMALGGTGLLMVDRAMSNRPVRLSGFQAFWVVVALGVVAIGLGLVYFAAFPAPLMAISIVLGLLAMPPLRAVIGRRLELALMADLRQYVAADVADEERGRLARELHDAPLQELAAVIRRLELVPGARDEAGALNDIAEQIRNVAIDLRPPMLDDIGLGAALDYLVEHVGPEEPFVTIAIQDEAGLERAKRPPASVEFALYRIVREALANAVRHAHAGHVAIRGSITPAAVDLEVVDDGTGFSGEASRGATGRGRLGLSSMRRRAQAIGADLVIDGKGPGTRVGISWRA